MNSVITLLGITTLLGSALVGGIFYAFSSFVMTALARMPSSEGIAAMQSINVAVINPSFLGAFIGTALFSLATVGLVLTNLGHPAATYFIAGAIFYSVGTFLVTVVGNVPLNDQLAAVSATEPDAVKIWQRYLDRWVMWNHVRTGAAMVAVLLFIVGLMQRAVG